MPRTVVGAILREPRHECYRPVATFPEASTALSRGPSDGGDVGGEGEEAY